MAALANVSVEYYIRLERGNLEGVSPTVLDAISGALLLDETESAYLRDLARSAEPAASPLPRESEETARLIQHVIDGMPALPAFAQNNGFDILHSNVMARALYSDLFDSPESRGNTARFAFLSPSARAFYVDWEMAARNAVGSLRVKAGRHPEDANLADLIRDLWASSETFRAMWTASDVHVHRHGVQRFQHRGVGRLNLEHFGLAPLGLDTISVFVFSEAPAPHGESGLARLAEWASRSDERI